MVNDKSRIALWQQLALILSGTAVAVVLVLGLLALFPNLVQTPDMREEAGTRVEVSFRNTDGDMFFYQPGRVRPPDEDVVLSQHVLAWDDNGFRVPALTAPSYPIAAFGDSFTEGTTVANPWPDVLAATLNVPVRNYGYRGYGPREIAATAEQFGAEDARTWVLYAHFSGNDLQNANRSLEQDLMGRNPFGQVQWIARRAQGNLESANIILNENDHYDYPMPVIIGPNYYELVFLEDLLWWQVAPDEGFLNTTTFAVVADALDTVSASVSASACQAVIFVPSKEQVYYPFVHPAERRWLRGIAQDVVVDDSGKAILRDAPLSEEDEAAFIDSLGDQRDALRQLATERGWYFIDLLEPFQERALAGELLYYVYDGHWNQAGHDLAGQIIADFMHNTDGCPMTSDA